MAMGSKNRDFKTSGRRTAKNLKIHKLLMLAGFSSKEAYDYVLRLKSDAERDLCLSNLIAGRCI